MNSTLAARRPETTAAGPGPRALITSLRAHARSRPDGVAVRDADGSLTYAELVEQARAIASRLPADEVPDAPVAVCGARDRNLVLGALAARLAGRPYLLLDLTQPLERSRFILADSGARVAITTSADGRERLAALGSPVEVLDVADVRDAIDVGGDEVAVGSMAYLCYTSGSTGDPKGVWVSTVGIDLLADWYVHTHQVAPGDRMSQVSSPSFDAWGLEVWPALHGGAELVVAAADTVRSPSALATWLVRTGIDICFLATPLAVEVLQEWPRDEDAARLRAMLVGGDRLVAPPTEAPPFRLFNNYGPTECSVVATAAEVTGFGQATTPPIGAPLPYVEAEVRRSDGSRCDVGEPGELFLGGPALSPGYVHASDTAAAFVREPGPGVGERTLYRTGDVVHTDSEGVLHYLGRTDDQVKMNGVRIEPAEVESALTSHPSVVDAAVVVQPTPSGDSRLVGYVVADQDEGPEPAAIRETVATRLPDAMVPAVVVVDRLPVTGNGKVDREALRAFVGEPSSTPAEHEDADDGIARVVEQAWVELLGLDGVGPDDDFFDLGGDSLMAMRLVRRLGKLGVQVTPEDLYRASSFDAFVHTLTDSGQEARRGA